MTVVPHTTYGIKANLTEIKVAFDSSNGIDSGMFVLKKIDGNLIFGSGYNAPTDLKPAITLVDGAYTFKAIGSSLSLVQGLKLKDISGGIDFENERVSFGGFLSIPLSEGKNIDIEISDWSIDAERFSGGLAVANLDVSEPLGFGDAGSENILVTNADLVFLNYSISSFNLGLNVKLAMLKNVNLKASLGFDEEGAVDFAVDLSSSTKKSFDVKFATLSVKALGAGYDSSDGLYFSVDAGIEMKSALLGGLPSDLTLDGLEVYASKIKVNDVGVSSSFSGHTASLSGIDLTLTSLGLGYRSNKFYLQAAGSLTVANLCEGGADITLYDDGKFTANDIRIAMTNPAMTIKGDLTLYKAGFSATLEVLIGDTLPLTGSLMLGRDEIMKGETVTSFVWWRAALKAGTNLSLAPIPLNIYGLGGGVGYNVQVVAVPGEEPTIGYAQVGLSLIASVDIGTTDNGNAWFGQLDLTLELRKCGCSLPARRG